MDNNGREQNNYDYFNVLVCVLIISITYMSVLAYINHKQLDHLQKLLLIATIE